MPHPGGILEREMHAIRGLMPDPYESKYVSAETKIHSWRYGGTIVSEPCSPESKARCFYAVLDGYWYPVTETIRDACTQAAGTSRRISPEHAAFIMLRKFYYQGDSIYEFFYADEDTCK